MLPIDILEVGTYQEAEPAEAVLEAPQTETTERARDK